MHGWTYSLETGIALSGSGRVGTYTVKVEGDDVYIEQPVRGTDQQWIR
jgi:nitrite reductase/ring-hydroxylating ferredoxin subunit